MAGFLYYLPKQNVATESHLREMGFDLVDLAALPGGACTCGPDGEAGALFGLSIGRAPTVGYYEETQTWREVVAGKLWIGWVTDDPPIPGDLQRPGAHAGHPVTLCDGNTWVIPVIRKCDGTPGLPYRWQMPERTAEALRNPDALIPLVEARVMPEYQDAWAFAVRVWESVINSEVELLPDAECIAGALRLLCLNYAVTHYEAMALGLLSPESLGPVLKAAIDIPSLPTIGKG